jgi:hypothetical protein
MTVGLQVAAGGDSLHLWRVAVNTDPSPKKYKIVMKHLTDSDLDGFFE